MDLISACTFAVRGIAAVLLLALAACASTSDFDRLDGVQPQGTPFQQALFANYALLARSFTPDGTSLSGIDDDMAALANAFAGKALAAAQGQDVAPETGNTPEQRDRRARLIDDLGPGRAAFPREAARAQADFDCWVLNGTVAAQLPSAARCRGSFAASLAQLERELRPPVAAAPAAQPAGYAAYFGFDSWTLTAEDLAMLQQVIGDARSSGQSHISVVGHTDTTGSDAYNLRLSKKRASVVKDALVDMGARRKAVDASGVGKNDLAVPTADNVREAKNRRALVTLQP